MRKLRCYQVGGMSVQEVLDDFNERAEEFGLSEESDVVSVSALPSSSSTIPIATPKGSVNPRLEVVIVYWSDQ